ALTVLRALAVAPVLAAALATALFQPMFLSRALLPVLGPVAIAASRALPSRPLARRAVALALALAGWTAFAREGPQEDMPAVIDAIAARAQPGDGVAIQPPFAVVVWRASLRFGSLRRPLPPLALLDVDAPNP